MLQPVRRVVTGTNKDGRSAVIFDGPAGAAAESPAWPGMGVTFLWKAAELPVSNAGDADAAAGPVRLMNSPRGVEFMLWQCPPQRELDHLTPQARAMALSPGGMIAADQSAADRHPGMHATETLDFLVVLSGEVTLILEAGETTLRAGDTLVDRGITHAWENRGDQTAICAIVNVGAQPLR